MEIIEKKEQKLIVGGGWILNPDGTWIYIPDDEPENDNININI